MTAEQLAKKIKRRKLSLWKVFLYLVPSVFIMAFVCTSLGITQKWLTIPLTVLLVIPVFYFSISAVKMMQNIIFIKCDPKLYLEVYSRIKKKENSYNMSDMITEIYGAFFSGDYNTVITYAGTSSMLFNPTQVEFMSYYIQSMFFLNDIQGVKEVYNKMKEKRNRKLLFKAAQKRMSNEFCNMDFAYYYLNGDYENAYKACKSYTEPPKNMPVLKFYNDYYTALCERALGNEEVALEKFRYIANQDNTLDVTRMAKERLK